MITRFFIAAALLLSVSINIQAQSYFFRKYQVENGLSNNSTICCLQDKKGFMWFGTKDGLNRFDGYSFKIFRNDPDDTASIGNNFIHSLYQDVGGTLFVGTESGLYAFNDASEHFFLIPGTVNSRIREIKKDAKGNLWFIAGLTLGKYEEATKHLETYAPEKYFESTSICITQDGRLWISTSNGYLQNYSYQTKSFKAHYLFHSADKVASKWIDKIYSSGDNILVGTSNQGVKLFDVQLLTYKNLLVYNEDKTEIFARNFIETSTGEFWVATETGVYILNIKTGKKEHLRKKINNPYTISDDAVYSFWKDNEGGIWICTYFGGINYYPKQYTPFKKHYPKDGENSITGNIVREIQQDRSGNLWIGTEDAGINKLSKKSQSFQNFNASSKKHPISYNNVHGMLIDGDELWIGTFMHGVDIIHIKKEKIIKHFEMGSGENALKSNFIYCIKKLESGEILLGTTQGLYLYRKKTEDFTLLQGMPLYNWYTCITQDNEKNIWAGTYGNGVNFFNPVTKSNGNYRYIVNDKTSLSSDRVNCIYQDSNKDLWFATEGGLCKFNKKSKNFQRFTTANGLPGNFILSILEDNRKNLWISTTKGLVKFSTGDEKIVTYTVGNGLLNDQFNFNSAFKDQEGRMYFGSVKGLVSFHPDEFIENSFVPPVYVTSLEVFNNELNIGQNNSPLHQSIIHTKKIILNYNESTINIGFAALGFTAPQMTEYAYKMEGLESKWTYLKQNRNAYFTNLTPGNYSFKVKATNSRGIWNGPETVLQIEILPPWWSSNIAYTLYSIGILLFIFLGFRYYHLRLEKKNRRKFQILKSNKEKEVLEAKIEFFTNVAHEIRTPLTLIKGPLEKIIKKAEDIPEIQNNLKIMDRNTNRLVDLTNQLLDFRQTEIDGFSLSFVQIKITEQLEEMFVNFKPLADEKDLLFTLKIPSAELSASVDIDAFNKILSNLLSNAVKYAKSEIKVSLVKFNEYENLFTIEIKNDGYVIPMEMKEKIFEPFFRLSETKKQKGTGIGLALSRSLAQLHKGTLDLKETEGIFNVFSLTLPIRQENEVDLISNPEIVTETK